MRIFSVSFLVTVVLCSFSVGQSENITSVCPLDTYEVFAKPTHLIRPQYPPAAIAVRATGDVVVFVTVNPEGKVLITSVQQGHPLLKKAGEISASGATFEPINGNCQRVATLIFTFLTGPQEPDEPAIRNPYHVEIFAKERPARKRVDGKDPCADPRFMTLGGEAPTLSIKEALQYPECVEGKPIRLYGIYRVAFENSDYYDPSGTKSAWLEFSPFYSILKKCSSPGTMNLLNSKNGGTFGLVAFGILRSGGGFGHMNGWDNEFQLICIDDIKKFSKEGVLFEYQTADVQGQILKWFNKAH